MTNSDLKKKRPPIHLIDTESDTLADLAMSTAHRAPEVSAMLLEEIDRAKIHTAAKLPANVITMMSTVEFVDEGNNARHKVQLVYPADADIAAGKISILTPVGAGLIGLTEGQSILWPDRDGHQRRLRIEKVSQK